MNHVVPPILPRQHIPTFNTSSTGQPPYEEKPLDKVGTVKPNDFATWVANMVLTAGGKQSTAFRCAMLIAEDMEARGLIK